MSSKTSSRRLQDIIARRLLQDVVLQTRLEDVLKTSWQRLEKTSSEDLLKTSWRCIWKTSYKHVLKTSSTSLGRQKIVALKTSWKIILFSWGRKLNFNKFTCFDTVFSFEEQIEKIQFCLNSYRIQVKIQFCLNSYRMQVKNTILSQ